MSDRIEKIKAHIAAGEDFSAHVQLIIHSGDETANKAGLQAWFEGRTGGVRRIAQFKEEQGL